MKPALLTLVMMIATAFSLCGHGGGTDSKGGHYNRSTGEYHYHHGNGPHQHPGGQCELSFRSSDNGLSHQNDNSLPWGKMLLVGLIGTGVGYTVSKIKSTRKG